MLVFPLYPIVLGIYVYSLSRLSQLNAKIRNVFEKNVSVVYANDTVLRCLTILAENHTHLF